MQTSPYSSFPWSSSRGSGSDSPETSSGRSNVVGLSLLQSRGSWKTRAIAVAVEAHLKLRIEPFAYVFNNLVEQKNCKVVVICCMSRIYDEMGVKHPIDLQTFGGVSKNKLDGAIGSQMNNLNHFLREFRKQLNEKGVELDIRISAGPKSHDILVEAAKAIRPQWVVIDKSFSRRKKEIKAGLKSNLVLMKKGQEIEILQVHIPKYLDPEDQTEDRVSNELPDLISSSRFKSIPGSRTQNLGSRADDPRSRTSRPISRCRYLCKRLKLFFCSMLYTGANTGDSAGDEHDGPTKNQTVLYSYRGPGSQAAYLQKMEHHQGMTERVAVLQRRSISSPAPMVNPTNSIWFNLAKNSNKNRSSKEYLELVVAEMDAQQAMHTRPI